MQARGSNDLVPRRPQKILSNVHWRYQKIAPGCPWYVNHTLRSSFPGYSRISRWPIDAAHVPTSGTPVRISKDVESPSLFIEQLGFRFNNQ